MNLNLTEKVAIVVASSQGIGKAIATQLVKEGVHVMIASRDVAMLEKVQNELEQLGKGKVQFRQTDVTKIKDLQALVKSTIESFGTIDILINNAGGPPHGTFDQFNDQDWQKAFELNLLSYIRMIREVIPFMKNKGGKIINVASSSIKQPIPGLILSNTFRLGIVGLTKTLAEELAPYNILINTVAPGKIATQRLDQSNQKTAEKTGISKEEVEQKAIANIPLGRYGTPEEFANYVTFLVSETNTYMTGQSFLVDGGMVKSI